MAIDKIFKSTNLDDVADNILSEVDDFVFSVDKMQQRKVAGNVQKVVQAFRQIETELQKRYDNVTDVLEKRITSINDGRDGLNGTDGRNGRDGKPGRDGINGKQGPPGTPGKDGEDGLDGVSVTNANIDFDGSLVISLSSGQQINVGEIVPPELERQLVELRQGGGSAGSSGDVMGPTASTDNAIVRFDGTTGKLVQNSVVTIADSTGNMTGIGTLTATGAGSIQGLTVGRGAGAVATNTAVGASALAANTTGSQDTALGDGALQSNTTGSSNLGLGYQAGYTNQTGIQNTSVGHQAGFLNTASSNLFFGIASGYNNTTATGVSYLGFQAGYYQQTGSYNTALGFNALSGSSTPANNTGQFNISIGSNTLISNTSGSGNVALGHGVLYLNTSGGTNVGIGQEALSASTTASKNTGVGYQAGSLITTGSKNAILGSYTGSAAPISATGSNFVVLSDGDGNIVASTKTAQTFALPGGTLTSGTGIAFPATQSASTNANTLDDYEEGTWTPSVGGTATYNTQSGVYTKIGRLVEVSFAMGIALVGTGSTTTISGLPFAQIAAAQRSTGAVGYYLSLAVNVLSVVSVIDVATTSIFFSGSTTASANITDSLAIFGNGANMYSSITYTA